MNNNNDNKSKVAIATVIIAALAASSCCIAPVIAAIAGIGGAASSLSWIEPLRPYLILLSVLTIGYAWYNHYKTTKTDTCGCAAEKPKWYQTKTFLIVITLFAAFSITFPYYSSVFYGKPKIISITQSSKQISVNIEGMTCEGCENHINSEVLKVQGVLSSEASHKEKNAVIIFDTTKTNI